jgi:hypothetical protein
MADGSAVINTGDSGVTEVRRSGFDLSDDYLAS